jgi:hypothetical protein
MVLRSAVLYFSFSNLGSVCDLRHLVGCLPVFFTHCGTVGGVAVWAGPGTVLGLLGLILKGFASRHAHRVFCVFLYGFVSDWE